MSSPLDTADTAIGLDIDITAANLELRVNDVPVFAPEAPIGSDAKITTHIPLNPAFRQGQNSVNLTLTPRSDAMEGFETDFRARLLWGPAGKPILPFTDTEHAIAFSLEPTTASSLRMVGTPGTQPHLAIFEIETATHADGTTSLDFVVDVDMTLPPFAWQEAEPITLTSETEAEIREAYARLHEALTRGEERAREALAPYIARQAAAIGATPDQFFDASLAPLFQPGSGFELVEMDPQAGEVQLFGNNRLAALLPFPLTFHNPATGQRAALFLYVWLDTNGDWRVIH